MSSVYFLLKVGIFFLVYASMVMKKFHNLSKIPRKYLFESINVHYFRLTLREKLLTRKIMRRLNYFFGLRVGLLLLSVSRRQLFALVNFLEKNNINTRFNWFLLRGVTIICFCQIVQSFEFQSLVSTNLICIIRNL